MSKNRHLFWRVMRVMRVIAIFLISLGSVFGWAGSCWSPEQLLELKGVGNVSLSPDGKSVIYSVATPSLKENRYLRQLYRAEIGQTAVQISPEHDSAVLPTWSPDGTKIAFLTDGGKKLFLISEGESILLWEGKRGMRAYVWSPDGQKIAFASEDLAQE